MIKKRPDSVLTKSISCQNWYFTFRKKQIQISLKFVWNYVANLAIIISCILRNLLHSRKVGNWIRPEKKKEYSRKKWIYNKTKWLLFAHWNLYNRKTLQCFQNNVNFIDKRMGFYSLVTLVQKIFLSAKHVNFDVCDLKGPF